MTLTAVTIGDFSEKNTKMTVADPARVRDLWLEPGDILVERANTPELVGTARLYRGLNHFAIFPDLLIRVRLADGVLPTFVEYALSTEAARSVFRHAAQGIAGSMPKIDQKTVERLPLPVAPTAEQHRIVDEVEKQFTRLDAAVASLQRIKANLKRYRASVLKAACEGRLVPTEAELARREGRAFESGQELLKRILKERRARWEADQVARMKAAGKGLGSDGWKARHPDTAPAGQGASRPLPAGWAVGTLRMLAELKGGITKGQKRSNAEKTASVPYLRVANVQRGFLDLREVKTIEATTEEIAELRLLSGDILFNEGGDRDKLGRGWIWSAELPLCIHQNHVFRARVFGDSMSPKFISWFGNTIGQKYFTDEGNQTTNLASINLTKLGQLPVPIPPLPEQHRIVAEVERRLSVVDELEATVEKNLARCARLRQAILKMAFEGRLVPQDPNDEPAFVLLERIRRERAAAGPTGATPRRRKAVKR